MNNSRIVGAAGGIGLAVVGSILLGQDGLLSFLGVLALLAGVAMVVVAMFKLIDSSIDTAAPRSGNTNASAFGALINLDGVKQMSTANQWIAGALMGVVALFGLFLFSRAGDGMFAMFGGVLFLFGIAVIVVLVHQATDYSTPAKAAEDAPAEAD